jgi:hypothetical protein
MKNSEKKETLYNKVVNISEDGEITLLEYTFNHSDGFKGAVGSIFYPITEKQIQEAISDYEDNDKELLIYMVENFGSLDRNMIENIDSSREALIDLFFDRSYEDLWDDLREQCNIKEEESVIFNCVGGGRCFDKNFEGNINPELSKIIREFEAN